MPNWCDNEMIISSDNKEQLQAFIDRLKSGSTDPEADPKLCEIFIPTPAHLLDVDNSLPTNPVEFANSLSGNKDIEYSSWYTWRLANWGTKWDVSDLLIAEGDYGIMLNYQTAWSPINDFWDKVSEEYPDLRFDERYLEEGLAFIGQIIREGGERVAEEYHDLSADDYIKAGAKLNEEGHVDWDVDQDYSLWDLFPLV